MSKYIFLLSLLITSLLIADTKNNEPFYLKGNIKSINIIEYPVEIDSSNSKNFIVNYSKPRLVANQKFDKNQDLTYSFMSDKDIIVDNIYFYKYELYFGNHLNEIFNDGINRTLNFYYDINFGKIKGEQRISTAKDLEATKLSGIYDYQIIDDFSDNRIIERNIYIVHSNREKEFRRRVVYDYKNLKNGNLSVEVKIFDDNGSISKNLIFEYDKTGILIKCTEGTEYTNYIYNKNGLLSEVNHYLKNSKAKYSYAKFKYDENNFLIEQENFNQWGSNNYCYYKFSYELDKNGNPKETTIYKLKENFGKKEYKPILKQESNIVYY